MGPAINKSTALLTEHLRYTPISLIDDIINSINEIGYKAVDAVDRGMMAASPASLGFSLPGDTAAQSDLESGALEEKMKIEIENGVHQFETLLEATLDKVFDKFEIVALRNTMNIDDLGDWLRLRHYEGLNFDLPSDTPTIESIKLQRNKYRATQRLNRTLAAEASKNAALLTNLKSLRFPSQASKTETSDSNSETYPVFGFLENKGSLADGTGKEPLKTNTEFALSQLPSLKTLLGELRPQMKDLATRPAKADPNMIESASEKSWRRERLEYIESQTRRHLENVSGLELGLSGEVRDGEWQGEGRRRGKGEVEDLERVVEMVGEPAMPQGDEMDERP